MVAVLLPLGLYRLKKIVVGIAESLNELLAIGRSRLNVK